MATSVCSKHQIYIQHPMGLQSRWWPKALTITICPQARLETSKRQNLQLRRFAYYQEQATVLRFD